MIGLIMWIIAFAGASYMAAKGIKDADYVSYDFEQDYTDEEKEEKITILRHYPDGTVEVDEQ
jgi:hypothetical protein